MKKVLLGGDNRIMIDDFFNQTDDYFSCMTTSDRYDDVKLHLEMFRPDVFVYCARGESRESIVRVMGYRPALDKMSIPFVLIGEKSDLEAFAKTGVANPQLEIVRPATISNIRKEILDMLKEIEEYKENLRREAEEREGRIREVELAANRRKRILVIDDDVTMLKTIRLYLEEHYEVACAPSGPVALKFLENKESDLVLLDYEMPNMDGSEVLHKIRENVKTAHLPVFFMTGVSDADKIRKVLAMNPQGYLLKPVEREKLLKTIEKEL